MARIQVGDVVTIKNYLVSGFNEGAIEHGSAMVKGCGWFALTDLTVVRPKVVHICPGCEQEIAVTDGKTECGGEGEGICNAAVYAYDPPITRDDTWAEIPGDGPPPSIELCAAIRQAHATASLQDNPRSVDLIVADIEKAKVMDLAWEIIKDVQSSYMLALWGQDGLDPAIIENVESTVADYLSREYGD